MTHPEVVTVAGVPVHFGRCDQHLKNWLLHNSTASNHVICDENTERHCLPLLSALQEVAHPPVVIPAGEKIKTLNTCMLVWKTLIDQGARRDSVIINLGGGVVTDLGGFCAATYMRGIRFIHVPTTLLGMCDAALGGKHGVDFDALKNYIGTFTQPEEIWIDPQFLHTLPRRQLRNGMAEVIKHALIGDAALFDFLEKVDATDGMDWLAIIRAAVMVKKTLVDEDVYERSGRRAALNFGHTIGHAIESHYLQQTDPLLHGECVALGMIAESWIAHHVLGTPAAEICHRICSMISAWIPVQLPQPLAFDHIAPFLLRDKKHTDAGSVPLSLIRALGEPETGVSVRGEVLREVFERQEVQHYLLQRAGENSGTHPG